MVRSSIRKFAPPLLLFGLAVAVRLPHSQEIPTFGLNELKITMELVNGEHFPLFNQHPHIGALSNYIHALAFWIFGLHYWLPQILAVVFGAATVPMVFFLGRRLFGTATGFLAAVLLIFSLYHVYFISHVAWSNCLAPFFVMLTLLFFFRALDEKSVGSMVASAFTYGLALQTHPSVITVLPALIAIFALQGRENVLWWLRKKSFYLVFPAAVLGSLNLLYFNLIHHSESIQYVMTGPRYALEKHPGISSYLNNSQSAWLLFLRLLSGEIESKNRILYLLDPPFILCAIGLTAGIFLCCRQRKWPILILLFFPIGLIPIFNQGYDFCPFGRYFGFLIPFGLLLISISVLKIVEVVRSSSTQRRLFIVLCFLLPAYLIGFHVWMLSRTYAAFRGLQETNDVLLRTLKMLDRYDKRSTTILLDPLSWQARWMFVFLKSDGWSVENADVRFATHQKEVDFNTIDLNQLPAQVRRLQSEPRRLIVAIVSPLLLKSFVLHAPIVSLDECLAKEPPTERLNIYSVLLNNLLYIFRLSPEPPDSSTWDEPLLTLRKYGETIPDDLTLGIPGHHQGRLERGPIPIKRLKGLADYFHSFCSKDPAQPEVNFLICKDKD